MAQLSTLLLVLRSTTGRTTGCTSYYGSRLWNQLVWWKSTRLSTVLYMKIVSTSFCWTVCYRHASMYVTITYCSFQWVQYKICDPCFLHLKHRIFALKTYLYNLRLFLQWCWADQVSLLCHFLNSCSCFAHAPAQQLHQFSLSELQTSFFRWGRSMFSKKSSKVLQASLMHAIQMIFWWQKWLKRSNCRTEFWESSWRGSRRTHQVMALLAPVCLMKNTSTTESRSNSSRQTVIRRQQLHHQQSSGLYKAISSLDLWLVHTLL